MADTGSGFIQLAGAVKVGGSSIDHSVLSSVRKASDRTGVSFAFLLAKAGRESSFRTDVSNARSSAHGLYQFTEQTWLEQMRRHGPDYGLGPLAEQIERRADGKLVVRDPEIRKQILDLRRDPGVSATMAAEYAAGNRAFLSKSLGREVGATDLYFAHFLGPQGAVDFLQALQRNPGQSAAEVNPPAAKANRKVFYDPTGRPKTVEEMYRAVAKGIDGSIERYAGASGVPERAPAPPGAKPDAPAPEDMGHGPVGPESPEINRRANPFPALIADKPAAPGPEDMGRDRPWVTAAMAALPPRPIAKPLPEDMGHDPVPPGGVPVPPGGPAETRIAEAAPAAAPNTAPETGPDTASAMAKRLADALAARDGATPDLEATRNALSATLAASLPAMSRSAMAAFGDRDLTLSTPGIDLGPGKSPKAGAMQPPVPTTPVLSNPVRGAIPSLQTADAGLDLLNGTGESGLSTSTFAVTAVLESFDPSANLTSVSGPIPRLSSYEPSAAAPQPAPIVDPALMTPPASDADAGPGSPPDKPIQTSAKGSVSQEPSAAQTVASASPAATKPLEPQEDMVASMVLQQLRRFILG